MRAVPAHRPHRPPRGAISRVLSILSLQRRRPRLPARRAVGISGSRLRARRRRGAAPHGAQRQRQVEPAAGDGRLDPALRGGACLEPHRGNGRSAGAPRAASSRGPSRRAEASAHRGRDACLLGGDARRHARGGPAGARALPSGAACRAPLPLPLRGPAAASRACPPRREPRPRLAPRRTRHRPSGGMVAAATHADLPLPDAKPLALEDFAPRRAA